MSKNLSVDDILSDLASKRAATQNNSNQDQALKPQSDVSITELINQDELKVAVAQNNAKNSPRRNKHTNNPPKQKTKALEEITIATTTEFSKVPGDDTKKSQTADKAGLFDINLSKKNTGLTPEQALQKQKLKKVEEISKALKKRSEDNTITEDEFIEQVNPLETKPKETLDEILLSSGRKPKLKSAARLEEVLKTNIKGKTEEMKIWGKTKELDGEKPAEQTEEKTQVIPPLFSTPAKSKEAFSHDSLLDTLNERLKKQESNKQEPLPTVPDKSAPLPPFGLNIDYEKQILQDTSSLQLLMSEEKIKALQALNEKKKRKLKDFVIESDDNTQTIDAEEEVSVEEETLSDEDSDVILTRLINAKKGLSIRAVAMTFLSLIAIIITFINAFELDVPLDFLSHIYNPTGYLYTFLVLGIISYVVCSTAINNGLTELFTLKGDSDSVSAIAFAGSLVAIVCHMNYTSHIMSGKTTIYMTIAIVGLLISTIGKVLMINVALKNFQFVAGDNRKYFIEFAREDVADRLTKGSTFGLPRLAVMRKTEYLSDFLQHSYCYDKADKISRVLAPAIFIAAVFIGIFTYFTNIPVEVMSEKLYWAISAGNAALVAAAPFSIMLLVSLPLYKVSQAIPKGNVAILGFNAVEEFSDVNAIAVDANILFPSGNVLFRNMKRCQKVQSMTEIAVDEAIILAASLAIKSGSVLAPMFFDMIGGKQELLHKVSGTVIEDGGGITGWVGNRRIMLGTREQMKSRQIALPSPEKEKKYSKGNDTIYLAVAGEAVSMFFVELTANPEIKRYVQQLTNDNMTISIKNVDGFITEGKIAELFDIEPANIYLLPISDHETYNVATEYMSKGPAGLSCSGTFTSYAQAILGAKSVYNRINYGSVLLVGSSILGVLLVMIFAMFTRYEILTVPNLLFFNLICSAIVGVSQLIKK